MKEKIHVGDNVIVYSITRSSRRKTSAIIVDANGIEVKVPFAKDYSEIEKMVSSRKKWIFKKQQEFASRPNNQTKAKLKTIEYLRNRTETLAARVDVKPSKIVIKNMRTRWGSTTKSGTVALNRAIVKAPSRIIDYIIIHELCHLKVRDHSSRFWNMLYRYDKNFESKKKWLEDNGHTILE